MPFATVKKKFQKLDKKQLVDLIGNLYKLNKSNQEYLDHFAEPDEAALFHKYKEQIIAAFYPPGNRPICIPNARKSLMAFQKLHPSPEYAASLLLVYVETGISFCNDFGYVDDPILNSLSVKFEDALKFIEKENMIDTFKSKAFQITHDASDIYTPISDYFADLCQYYLGSNPHDPE